MATKIKKNPFMLVRIKTYNKGLGHVARRFTVEGKRFDSDNGWYKVGRGMAGIIAKEKHPSSHAEVFDVVELAVAQELVEAEAHEPWSSGVLDPERAPEVKIKEFVRHEEIKAERAAQGEDSNDGWDDESPERSVTRATPAPDDDEVAKPKKVTKKVTKKTGTTATKKVSRRRSATK